ncbi:hypothetical protein AMAG_04852 [Allomyces macrogynus ATCC 38327]|uniref:C2 domain-containing protein n=1 Tax=Allomyces macrogynus (strain ATCC 38327) TaxID=578462 RepID=A0A0L0S6K3_ALLM3|nr:hypothetical protein AMAG_04852 [Allomyces macrogynus ATCC 38327]|eukprot:KNE58026.1 hypothetical protein AMAG_04852 [Allomyces macrogynus ATCC 38327]
MPHGTLEVNCVAGRQLRDVEMFGKQDPYLKLALETQTQKTRAHASGGRNPTWNTTLVFNIFEGARALRVEAWDEDATSDDLIGMTTIDLSRAFATGVDDQWFPLFTKSGKPAGEVHLVLYFKNHMQGQQPPPQGQPGYSTLPPPGAYPGQPPAYPTYPGQAPPSPQPGYAPPAGPYGYPADTKSAPPGGPGPYGYPSNAPPPAAAGPFMMGGQPQGPGPYGYPAPGPAGPLRVPQGQQPGRTATRRAASRSIPRRGGQQYLRRAGSSTLRRADSTHRLARSTHRPVLGTRRTKRATGWRVLPPRPPGSRART